MRLVQTAQCLRARRTCKPRFQYIASIGLGDPVVTHACVREVRGRCESFLRVIRDFRPTPLRLGASFATLRDRSSTTFCLCLCNFHRNASSIRHARPNSAFGRRDRVHERPSVWSGLLNGCHVTPLLFFQQPAPHRHTRSRLIGHLLVCPNAVVTCWIARHTSLGGATDAHRVAWDAMHAMKDRF